MRRKYQNIKKIEFDFSKKNHFFREKLACLTVGWARLFDIDNCLLSNEVSNFGTKPETKKTNQTREGCARMMGRRYSYYFLSMEENSISIVKSIRRSYTTLPGEEGTRVSLFDT